MANAKAAWIPYVHCWVKRVQRIRIVAQGCVRADCVRIRVPRLVRHVRTMWIVAAVFARTERVRIRVPRLARHARTMWTAVAVFAWAICVRMRAPIGARRARSIRIVVPGNAAMALAENWAAWTSVTCVFPMPIVARILATRDGVFVGRSGVT